MEQFKGERKLVPRSSCSRAGRIRAIIKPFHFSNPSNIETSIWRLNLLPPRTSSGFSYSASNIFAPRPRLLDVIYLLLRHLPISWDDPSTLFPTQNFIKFFETKRAPISGLKY